MIRKCLLAVAFLVAGLSSIARYGDTRALLRGSRTIPELLNAAGVSRGVVIVLQKEDCRRSEPLVSGWNALHADGRFPVTGLVVGTGRLSARGRSIVAHDGVRIPLQGIVTTDAELIAHELGFRSTPFAIVLDHRGRVAGAFAGTPNVPPDVLAHLMSPGSSSHQSSMGERVLPAD
jgi:hypothetical protein